MQCAHVTRAKKSEYSGVCCHIYVVGKCVGIYLRANTSAGKYGIRYSKQNGYTFAGDRLHFAHRCSQVKSASVASVQHGT